MNRFKFRVWDIDQKYYLNQDGEYCFYLNHNDFQFPVPLSECLRDTKRYIVQQFTGLTDTNNKEIYEGDILTNEFVNPENQTVIYENGKFTVTNITIGCNDLFDEISQSAVHRIIGNIFENPELLKS